MKILRLLPLLATLILSGSALAQTATFTWIGSTDFNPAPAGVALVQTINSLPANPSIGYGASLDIANLDFLGVLSLPQPGTCPVMINPDGSCSLDPFPAFPNNGFLDCGVTITWGNKMWGQRADGSQMDGTKAGDSYTQIGTAVCQFPDGTVNVTLIPFRQIVALKPQCRFGKCIHPLVDTMESGSGTAAVAPIPPAAPQSKLSHER